MVGVRVAGDQLGPRADAHGRAVAGVVRGGAAVELDEHGVVHVRVEGLLDGVGVQVEAIGGDLDSVRQPAPQVVHEREGVGGVAGADQP